MSSYGGKDPNSVLDWVFDWSVWLGEDETIASYVVDVPEGLSTNGDSATDTAVTVWLAGGTVGSRYRVVCRISTSAARTEDHSLLLTVYDR